jgi:WD40-like Beta Propeller Repeat
MRFWTATAVAFTAFFAATGCNDYGNTFQANTGAVLQFVSPANVTAGGPALTITLTGTGFVVQTVATWDQKNLKTCVVTTTAANVCAPPNDTGSVVSVTAAVPAALTATPGTHFIQTVQPHSGAGTNGLSNALSFVVFPPPNPIPTVSSISPNSAVAGSAAVTLTITGTNFILTTDPTGGSQVFWNTATQTSLSIISISTTQIQATVTAPLLATAGTASVTVNNLPEPPPKGCVINCNGYGGGGTSNATTFTITAAGGNNASASAAVVEEETPAVSLDGRYVAYTGSQNGHAQIFARDTCQGADSSCQPRTLLISSALDGTAASDDSHAPSMSADGRYVAFSSAAPNLVADAAGTGRQVYLRDSCFGVGGSCTPSTQLVSTDPSGALLGTESILPSVSSSGRFIAFLSVMQSQAAQASATSNQPAASAANSGYRQVFVRDTCLGVANCTPKTTRISLEPGDGSGTGATKQAGPAISGSANNIALAGGATATLFTRSVAVDDGVFLALTKNQ